ncbi:MAG: hypothetical protein ACRYG5_12830 [Janthinobacterium lividum]
MARRSRNRVQKFEHDIEPLTKLPFVREQCPKLWNTPPSRGHIADFEVGYGWADDFMMYLDRNPIHVGSGLLYSIIRQMPVGDAENRAFAVGFVTRLEETMHALRSLMRCRISHLGARAD